MSDAPAVGRLGLPSSGELAAVGELRAALLQRLAAGEPLHLDGSAVEEPSTALVQLIEAAAVSFGAQNLQLGLINPSDALCTAYEDLGLFGALMMRTAIDA